MSGFNWRLYPPKELNKGGLYKYVRHPSYTGGMLIVLGLGGLVGGIGVAILSLWIMLHYWLDRIDREEQMLLAVFGQQYIDYMKKTKMFIPFII